MQISPHAGSNPVLFPDEVHIWRVSLGRISDQIQSLRDLLSEDELARADRFHFERERRRFIASRGVLRQLLGTYLGVEPQCMTFSYNQYGKPALKTTHELSRLAFNLSHSHDLILYAISRDRRLGIDVERYRTVDDMEGIARRYFSAHEYVELESVQASGKQAAFFNCWTRKEAFIKGIGKGLSLPLDQFDVSLSPGKPARILAVRKKDLDASRWTLEALPVDPNYAAALAVEGHGLQLTYWQYP